MTLLPISERGYARPEVLVSTEWVAEHLDDIAPDGRERQAETRDFTHIRWSYVGELPPGKRGEVGFRVVIK